MHGSVAALASELSRSDSHESAACLAVHLARSYASATALFSVRNRTIAGMASSGLEARERRVLLTTDVPCLFSRVAVTGQAVRGVPGGNVLDKRVLDLLGRGHAREMVLLPVELRGRVLALLYADNGADALGDAALAGLHAVGSRLSKARSTSVSTSARNVARDNALPSPNSNSTTPTDHTSADKP